MDIQTFRRTLLHHWPGTISYMVQKEINQLQRFEAKQLSASLDELSLYYELVDNEVAGPLREEFELLSQHGIPIEDFHSSVFEQFRESIGSRNITSESSICMNCDREENSVLPSTHQKNGQDFEHQTKMDAMMSNQDESAMEQQLHSVNQTDDTELEIANAEKYPQKSSIKRGHSAKRARLV